MRRVVIESPYAGATPEAIAENVKYARACVRDSLMRGEAPIASHLLHTQDGILRDGVPEERRLGINAGHEWIPVADLVAIYTDCGMSAGMKAGLQMALNNRVRCEYRSLVKRQSVAPNS